MKALIGTTNPGKIEGAKEALEVFYKDVEVTGYKASSNVGDQPVNEETLDGARNRALNVMAYAKANNIDAEFFMGIESGIINLYDNWFIANAAVIIDKDGYESIGYGPIFPVPKKYVKEIIETDFGHVAEKIFNQSNLGQSVGGVNGLTNHSISRIDITRESFIMALTEHANNYWNDKDNTKQKD